MILWQSCLSSEPTTCPSILKKIRYYLHFYDAGGEDKTLIPAETDDRADGVFHLPHGDTILEENSTVWNEHKVVVTQSSIEIYEQDADWVPPSLVQPWSPLGTVPHMSEARAEDKMNTDGDVLTLLQGGGYYYRCRLSVTGIVKHHYALWLSMVTCDRNI